MVSVDPVTTPGLFPSKWWSFHGSVPQPGFHCYLRGKKPRILSEIGRVMSRFFPHTIHGCLVYLPT